MDFFWELLIKRLERLEEKKKKGKCEVIQRLITTGRHSHSSGWRRKKRKGVSKNPWPLFCRGCRELAADASGNGAATEESRTVDWTTTCAAPTLLPGAQQEAKKRLFPFFYIPSWGASCRGIQEMQFSLNYKGKHRRARTGKSCPLAIQHLFSPFYLTFTLPVTITILHKYFLTNWRCCHSFKRGGTGSHHSWSLSPGDFNLSSA